MPSLRPAQPVTVAHAKTLAVQDDVRQAEADLHDANEVLADTVVGTIVTKETVEAALVQNLHVESELHDAVKELQVVTDLLKVAEQQIAAHDHEGATAGRRSGEGVKSVLAHMSASSRRRDLNR